MRYAALSMAFLLIACRLPVSADPQYQLVCLDPAPVTLRAVNNSGQVLGDGIWHDGGYQSLYFGIATFSIRAINNNGQVAGMVPTTEKPVPYDAAIWSNGVITDLGRLPGYDYSEPSAINDHDQVVGWSSRQIPGLGPDAGHAFIWDKGVMTDMGTLGGEHSQAYAINNKGQAVGRAQDANKNDRGFTWENGVITDLGAPDELWAVDINDNSQILFQGGYVQDGNTVTYIGDLGGGYTEATAINNLGWVTGSSLDASGYARAFIWKDGVMTSLESLIPAGSGWRMTEAYDINDQGWIVGYGYYYPAPGQAPKSGAFLIKPVPEPSSLAVLAVAFTGLVGVVGWRRRQP